MSHGHQSFSLDLERISRAFHSPKIAYPESSDPRISQSIQQILSQNIRAQFIVWDRKSAEENPQHAVHILDLCSDIERRTGEVLEKMMANRGKKISSDEVARLAKLPLYQAGAMLHFDEVDCAIAGSIATTADVIRAALATVGPLKSGMALSGAFFMEREADLFLYSDCGVIPDPTAEQLAGIAVGAFDLWETLKKRGVNLPEARMTFLSFSTKGSARHVLVDKVLEGMEKATEMLRGQALKIDGELQFDAAIDAAIGTRKAPGSDVAGAANIFIFPDLNAGNIAYKMTQRLAGFRAYGPLLCGIAAPYCDLSRGSTVDDIVYSTLISLLRAKRR